jgi:hypothetical protein
VPQAERSRQHANELRQLGASRYRGIAGGERLEAALVDFFDVECAVDLGLEPLAADGAVSRGEAVASERGIEGDGSGGQLDEVAGKCG